MSSTALRRNELGFTEVLFQALASAAPGLSVTLAVVVGANYAGGALGLSLIFALVGILLVATCIGQMAQRFPSAAGFYTYVSRGLHPSMGPMVAWLYLAVWIVFPSTLFLPFGNFVSSTLHSSWGWSETPVWIVCAALCMVLVFSFVYSGARFSTNVGIVLGMTEFLILGVLALTLIAKAGSHNTLSVFGTSHADVKGFAGMSGIFAGMVYAIYGFVGFENVAPLAEEAKNPRRSVMKAALLSPLILGVFIIVCTYAVTVYFGPSKFGSFTSFNGGDAWIGVTKEVWHDGWYVLWFALLNSCVASANGATNAGTRHMYSMGRINLLPARFARTSEKTGVPTTALAVVAAVSLVATYVTGSVLSGGPLEAFAFLGTIETITAILLYMLVALAALVYFLRTRESGYNPLLHTVVPILAIAVMIPALMAAVGIGSGVFSFISPLPSPFNIAAWITVGWLVLGVVYAVWIWTQHPDRARATEHIFIDEPEPAAAGAPAAAAGAAAYR
ncbi:APC family permease [Candidatus Solirubrobacter pratensis]|uniref:APC family permease n=1 Tax=Candidatus Solirubrobacter pratensis TaxID=1298857 RepID=UPI000425B130|nr:APC family permease [Candidatus Solirubrobacter pratensis]